MKKVSIIIACYNHGKFLEQSVKSAIDQDYPNLEIIIANDGSTDNSLDVANNLKSQNDKIKVISHENIGVVATRNNAIAQCEGDYILPLDADDYLAELDVISEMVRKLEDSEADLVFGNHRCFGGRNDLVRTKFGSMPELLVASFISATSLYKKDTFNKIGGYSKEMSKGFEDWDFAIRMMEAGKVEKIEKTIFNYRVSAVSRDTEANKIRNFLFEKIVKNNSELYISNISSIINIFERNIEEYRKKRKKQNKIKKAITAFAAIELIAILALVYILIK